MFIVVGDDGLKNAKPANDRLPDELGCVPLGDGGKGFCLYPLGEVINGDDRELGLTSAGGKWTDQVDPPFGERIRAAKCDQLCGGCMGDVGKTLTLITFEHEISRILIESWPEITSTEYFVGQRPAARMIATNSLMDFPNYIDCLSRIEASQV